MRNLVYRLYHVIDDDKQREGNAESGDEGSVGIQENHGEEENTPLRKKSKKKLKAAKKSPAASRAKPSFPAKKRVQVPQDILSETPLRDLKSRGSLSRINKEGTQKASTKGKEMEIQSKKGDHVKEPFFWLREEQEGEMLSGRTDEDQIIEGSTPVPPSFSDLKDADDESPTNHGPSVSTWPITKYLVIRTYVKSHMAFISFIVICLISCFWMILSF